MSHAVLRCVRAARCTGLLAAAALLAATATVPRDAAAAGARSARARPPAAAKGAEARRVAAVAPVAARTAPAAAPAPGPLAAEPSVPRRLLLQPGEQQVLPVSGALARVSVANEAVAEVMPLRDGGRDSVRLRALAVGRTDLLIWSGGRAEPQRHEIEVRARSGALEAVAGAAGGARLEGEARDLPEHEQARRELEHAGAGREAAVDASRVAVPQTVQVDVHVVEFSRSLIQAAGLNLFTNRSGFSYGVFSPSTLGKVTQGPALGGSAGVGRNDFPRLRFSDSRAPFSDAFNLLFSHGGLIGHLSLLEGQGLARVLAEPSLVAMSGQHASFLAGGEIPIPIPQGLGSVAIEYKAFGIGLTVTPTVLANDRIVLKVAPEASDLDYGNALQINGTLVPAIITRRTDTTVELGDGESFVIGGLVNTTTTSNVDKVPLLGDLPVIGSFFKNLRHTKDERELLILVTPRLVRPLAAGAQRPPLPGEGRERDGVWRDHLLGPLGDAALPGFSN